MEQEILLNTYLEGLYLKEDLQYLDEGLKDIMSKFTQPVLKRIMPQMFNVASSKNPQDFEKLLNKNGVKRRKINPKEVEAFAMSMPPEIQQGAAFAKRVIDNSFPKGSKAARTLASYFVTLMAKIKNPRSSNLLGAIKGQLKVYIPKIRTFYDEVEEKATETGKRISSEDMADIAIGIASLAVAAVLAGVAVVAAYHILVALMTILTALKFIVPAAIAAGLIIMGFKYGSK